MLNFALFLALLAGAPKAPLVLANRFLRLEIDPQTGALKVTDLRNGKVWKQVPSARGALENPASTGTEASFTWRQAGLGLPVRVKIALSGDSPAFTATLSARGALGRPLRFPHPFKTEPPTYLVIPMNEGISYPVEDKAVRERRLIAYGGHGICMAFWGVTDGTAALMGIFETPDDAAIKLRRLGGLLVVEPQWDSQKGRFGYPRTVRYELFDRGGYVAMCKAYRSYVRKRGNLKTLKQKAEEIPAVDLLIGAVNIWNWDRDPLGVVKELRQAGIRRILWSRRAPPHVVRAMNNMGILTSRYDIYQDLMDPEIVREKLRGRHPDWPQEGWPDDLNLGPDLKPRRGWRVRGKDGKFYACGVLCDKQALRYARKRVPADLATHPYRCRFIDTTTASPWRECYHPKHPMTRSESKYWKMQLLAYMSREMHLVTGSETGHEAAVPYVHYFEGMLSLGPYRVPDAGRKMARIWYEVPERVRKFQLGHRYRLPLWELVYHDCVVAQWYWGDYNNKLPALWDKRDLFNVLYGTPPMFMFTKRFFRENRGRFVRSYRATSPVARATGYSEMIDHRFLTPDRDVQQTRFANGIKVTVNFGNKPFTMEDGSLLAPGSYKVEKGK